MTGIHPFGKEAASLIFSRTLAAIDIRAILSRKLARRGSLIHCGSVIVDLNDFREIVVIAIGKAAIPMAEALAVVLAPEVEARGILAAPTVWESPLPNWESYVSGHPIPNAASFAAGGAILHQLRDCDAKTLLIFLLSGGGSALVEQPLDPAITLDDFQQLQHALVTCGAPIEAMNAVRKHVSATKGGRLAAAAPKSMKLTFAISDVPDGHESALASGPTLPDPTTVEEAERVVREYGIISKIPAILRAHFEQHAIPETPKPGDAAFARAHFELLLGARDLFHHAHHQSESAGYMTICDNSTDNWPLEEAADSLIAQLQRMRAACPGKRVAVIADGELSSPVTGNGMGGRNSAFVLACVEKIAGHAITVLSAGTDGVDGNSPAAGGVADGQTLSRARALGLDPTDFFRRSDSYTFFSRLGDSLEMGPTGNNLRDLRILLHE